MISSKGVAIGYISLQLANWPRYHFSDGASRERKGWEVMGLGNGGDGGGGGDGVWGGKGRGRCKPWAQQNVCWAIQHFCKYIYLMHLSAALNRSLKSNSICSYIYFVYFYWMMPSSTISSRNFLTPLKAQDQKIIFDSCVDISIKLHFLVALAVVVNAVIITYWSFRLI